MEPHELPPHLSPCERTAICEFVAAVRQRLGDDLLDTRLFGSRARGEGGPDSDLDVVFIVTRAGRVRRREIYDVAFDIGLDHQLMLAPLVIEQDRLEDLRARERLIAQHIERDGIPLESLAAPRARPQESPVPSSERRR